MRVFIVKRLTIALFFCILGCTQPSEGKIAEENIESSDTVEKKVTNKNFLKKAIVVPQGRLSFYQEDNPKAVKGENDIVFMVFFNKNMSKTYVYTDHLRKYLLIYGIKTCAIRNG